MEEASCSNSDKGIRCYKTLPVWVVEDHNDVLPHIYRAVASRHLPFSGVTMLHFDSHPDLQIGTDMDADIVYNKEELLSTVSIENWIMPALYAGHIDHVIWVKPPWADQLPEGSQRVSIGKHEDTGKLRVTWPDDYFLSDLLYAPLNKLTNSKTISIDTVTMESHLVKFDSNSAKVCTSRTSCISQQEHSDSSGDCNFKHVKRTKLDKDESRNESVDLKALNSTNDSDFGKQSEENQSDSAESTNIPKQEVDNVKAHDDKSLILEHSCSEKTIVAKQEGVDVKGHIEVISMAVGSTKPFILDIDLDFFSTKNPFKEVYNKEQLKLLEELYSFKPASNNTVEALEYCQQERALQLKELEACVRAAWDATEPTCEVDTNRLDKTKSLISSLRLHPPADDPLDAELIHMAGLTCDDSGELPHHISTEAEIDSLVEAVKELLGKLPKPTIITIARSSHDDYCPPDQVDSIQRKVLQMLESVYGKVNVTMDYEKQP